MKLSNITYFEGSLLYYKAIKRFHNTNGHTSQDI